MFCRRTFCFALAFALCLCSAAWAEESAGPSYRMAGLDQTQYRSWENNAFFTRMEQRTGVRFTFQQYTKAEEWTNAKAAMTADAADLPDVLFKAALTGGECISLRENGVLIDLKPLLEENCPNLWAILSARPDLLSAITLPDGSIAALPFISFPANQNYLWINTEWLSNLHLEKPTTAQELVDVLTAFLNKDPNRNGRSDEIPLGFLGPFDLKFLGHAFGLIANDYNVFAENGQAKFMPLEDNFRLFITWLRDLYQAGLMDKNGFVTSDDLRAVTDSNATATYGVMITQQITDLFKVTWASKYEIMMPLSYNGERVYRDFSGPLIRGTFAITSACKDPEKLLQWVDFLYTEEGAILSGIGKENEDYVVDGDGTWRFLESVQNNYDTYRASTLIDGGSVQPGVLARDFEYKMSGTTQVQEILDKLTEFGQYTVMPFPYYTLTQAQQDTIQPLQEKIGYYVDMQIARWVLGEEEISDDTFSAFAAELEQLGLPDFMAFWQSILDETTK
ncbi:MAG: extracellular solute-binding protein [Clostridia bacterium]|nr:extracellular solute-binding protein [Clostridia bacterium]